MNTKDLCLELAKVDSEEEVIELLEKNGYWKDTSLWKFFNNDENILDKIKDFSRIVSPVLLPMIATLGDLDLNED